jgi:signal-transduction protein with cAMP-binding, CBS, and nucleotidyltransferase domain
VSRMLRDVMTRNPVALDEGQSCLDAARTMADSDIGDVIVRGQDGKVCGIVTDRDLVVRALAKGLDPAQTRIGDVCTRDVVSLTPDSDTDEALVLMRDRRVRRLPVVQKGEAVGIVSLGDLAETLDPRSVLGELSAAPPNN